MEIFFFAEVCRHIFSPLRSMALTVATEGAGQVVAYPSHVGLDRGFSLSAALTLGAGGVFVVGVPCALDEAQRHPLVSNPLMLEAAPSPSCDKQKCVQIFPDVPWGGDRIPPP